MEQKPSQNMYLYVLECSGGKYYVGIAYDVKKRLKQHFEGKGSVFTQMYAPLKLSELFYLENQNKIDAELFENYKTVNCAIDYGFNNVAGGNFTSRDDFRRGADIQKAITKDVFKNNKFCDIGEEKRPSDTSYMLKLKEFEIKFLDGDSIDDIVNNITVTPLSDKSSFVLKKEQGFDNKNHITETIKEFRKLRNIRIGVLAKQTGVSRNLISRIENGNGNPSFKNVVDILTALGLELRIAI